MHSRGRLESFLQRILYPLELGLILCELALNSRLRSSGQPNFEPFELVLIAPVIHRGDVVDVENPLFSTRLAIAVKGMLEHDRPRYSVPDCLLRHL